jgi:hypothetical protein
MLNYQCLSKAISMRLFVYFVAILSLASGLHGMEMEPKTATLISNLDGKRFTIPREIAEQAENFSFKDQIKKEGYASVDIPGYVLEEVANFMQLLYQNKNLAYEQLLEKAEKEIPIKNNYFFAAAVRFLDFKPGIDLISYKYVKTGDYSMPNDIYEFYMKAIRKLNSLAYEKLRVCEKARGKPCIDLAVNKGAGPIRPGDDQTQGYPIIQINPGFEFMSRDEKLFYLSMDLDFYERVAPPIVVPEGDRKLALEIIKDIAPDLYHLLVSVDPSGIKHIVRDPNPDQLGVYRSGEDGLPIFSIGYEFLQSYPKLDELKYAFAHELGHYVLGHPKKSIEEHEKSLTGQVVTGRKKPEEPLKLEALRETAIQEFKKGKKVSGQLAFEETFGHAYSRVQEFEADRFAIRDLGQSINAGITFGQSFSSRAKEHEIETPEKATFKSTHPLMTARIQQLKDLRREVELNKERGIKPKPINWKELAAEYLKEKKPGANI